MIDALLFAARDAIRTAGFGYGVNECEVMEDGQPPARCGNIFLAVHQGSSLNSTMNYIDEYYSWSVTMTQRVTVPHERVGEQLLARNLPTKMAQNYARAFGFNSRIDQIRRYLNMNWTVMQTANNYLLSLNPDAFQVWGFCEPAHDAGMPNIEWAYGDWFTGNPEAQDVGLRAEMRFVDCRRIQGMEQYV